MDNEDLIFIVYILGIIFCIGTFVSGILTTRNLHKNYLVKNYLDTLGASIAIWVLWVCIIWFFVITNKKDSLTSWLVFSFTFLSLSLIIINSILLSKKSKLTEEENKAIENGDNQLEKVDFNVTIYSIVIDIITFILTIYILFNLEKNNNNNY